MVIKVDKLHLFEFFSRLYFKHFVCLQVNVKWWCVGVFLGCFLCVVHECWVCVMFQW
jgi:hypothetical protein